jgi:hypothetical protein
VKQAQLKKLGVALYPGVFASEQIEEGGKDVKKFRKGGL